MSELRVETNEALQAAGKTGAESLSRAALLLVRRRAAAHLEALDVWLKELGE
jgi:hypothetical protein